MAALMRATAVAAALDVTMQSEHGTAVLDKQMLVDYFIMRGRTWKCFL